MRRLGISQRVDFVSAYGEHRDGLDQRWTVLAQALDSVPLPLPNLRPDAVSRYLDATSLDAVLLSGGNSIAVLDPGAHDAAPERDAFEASLLDEARRRGLPIVGVCRGMQMINLHLGGGLSRVDGHIATRHDLVVAADYEALIELPVNSFHGYGVPSELLAPSLVAIASDGEGHVEAFVHSSEPIAGILWHPERESPLRFTDIELLKGFLK